MERERYGVAAGAPTVAQHDAQLRQQQASNPYGSFASASTMSYKPGVSNRQPTAVPSWRREQQQVAAMMNKQPAVTQGQTTYGQPTYASAYQNRNSFVNNRRQYGNTYFRPTFQNRLPSR